MEGGSFVRRDRFFLVAVLVAGVSQSAPNARAQTDGSPNPLASVDAETMRSFIERPLFSPSRRPPGPPPTALAPPPVVVPEPGAERLRLLGTLLGPFGASALILDTSSGVTSSMTQGETVSGWHIVAIEPAAVRLERGAQSTVLALFQPGMSNPPKMATPALQGGGTAQTSRPPVAVAPAVRSSGANAAPPGTVPGTAAAQAASESPFQLTFGAPPPATAQTP